MEELYSDLNGLDLSKERREIEFQNMQIEELEYYGEYSAVDLGAGDRPMSWDAVEADIVALLRQSSALRTEVKNCRAQAREEMKSRLLGLVEVAGRVRSRVCEYRRERERRR